jgi:hypothetical protein
VTHFEIATGLDEAVAQHIVRPAIERINTLLSDEAKRRAPEVKVWVTAHDERVRPSHVETDGQAIPENLRFQLPKMIYVSKGRGPDGHALNPAGGYKVTPGDYDMAREPRDASLPIAQRANCRCDSPRIPTMLKDSINEQAVVVSGTRVTGGIETRFPRAAESENGTAEDRPAHFMLGAVEQVRRILESQR